MTEKPEKINDDITLLQNPGSLAFGTDAYLLSAYLRHAQSKRPVSLAQAPASFLSCRRTRQIFSYHGGGNSGAACVSCGIQCRKKRFFR